MAVKTREKLIDVARQLFARNGVENTTMNDIAEASAKGRRTIYTYFKNKLEIFNAVVERESDEAVVNLREVLHLETSPKFKLEQYLRIKFKLAQEALIRQESLASYFRIDSKRFNRIKRLTAIKENEILQAIFDEGIAAEEFSEPQTKRMASLMSVVFQGASVQLESLAENNEKEEFENNIIKFIIEGITIK